MIPRCIAVTLATSVVLVIACSEKALTQVSPAVPAEVSATGRVDIVVTERGFEPAAIHVKRGAPVTLAFTRKTDKTCATEVVIDLGDGRKLDKALPLGQVVEIPTTFARTGRLRYACGMDMVSGVITVD